MIGKNILHILCCKLTSPSLPSLVLHIITGQVNIYRIVYQTWLSFEHEYNTSSHLLFLSPSWGGPLSHKENHLSHTESPSNTEGNVSVVSVKKIIALNHHIDYLTPSQFPSYILTTSKQNNAAIVLLVIFDAVIFRLIPNILSTNQFRQITTDTSH